MSILVGDNLDSLLQAFAWDGDRLAVADSQALDAQRRDYLSPSTAEAMQGCAARWIFEKHVRAEPDLFGPAELGTAAHSVLEHLWNLPADARTRLRAMGLLRSLADQHFDDSNDENLKTEWIAEVRAAYLGYFELENPHEVKIVATEQTVTDVEVAGVPFFGKIDRIIATDGGIGIDDTKTGKVPKNIGRYGDKHGDQLRLYSEALRVRDGVQPERAGLLYTRHAVHKNVALSKPRMRETLSDFADSWDTFATCFRDAAFETKASPLCGWCPLVNLCPAAQEAGFRQSDRAVPAIDARDHTIAHTDAPAPREQASPDAAYSEGGRHATDQTPEKDTIMETKTRFIGTKPWDEFARGQINPNSYAVAGVIGTTELAYETLASADQTINRSSVRALTQTFAKVIESGQEVLVGTLAWNDNSNTRARGALRSVLQVNPFPFGSSSDELDAWFALAVRQTRSIIQVAMELHEQTAAADDDDVEGLPEQPWAHFAASDN
ncbi:RecB family exonuclease [Aeromicrobium sp. CTD01-1L150]|uniref:RecB family exonuclease n=1 Tax=Aeromicrobium sp. CTD01-1L150 TaxID=3341830 RepID=UPI0035C22D0B